MNFERFWDIIDNGFLGSSLYLRHNIIKLSANETNNILGKSVRTLYIVFAGTI